MLYRTNDGTSPSLYSKGYSYLDIPRDRDPYTGLILPGRNDAPPGDKGLAGGIGGFFTTIGNAFGANAILKTIRNPGKANFGDWVSTILPIAGAQAVAGIRNPRNFAIQAATVLSVGGGLHFLAPAAASGAPAEAGAMPSGAGLLGSANPLSLPGLAPAVPATPGFYSGSMLTATGASESGALALGSSGGGSTLFSSGLANLASGAANLGGKILETAALTFGLKALGGGQPWQGGGAGGGSGWAGVPYEAPQAPTPNYALAPMSGGGGSPSGDAGPSPMMQAGIDIPSMLLIGSVLAGGYWLIAGRKKARRVRRIYAR